jgi:hypothetical protein
MSFSQPEMLLNGLKRNKRSQNDFKRPVTLENGPKQLKALHNDPKWLKTTRYASESSKNYSKRL